jgi:hypothetical protein
MGRVAHVFMLEIKVESYTDPMSRRQARVQRPTIKHVTALIRHKQRHVTKATGRLVEPGSRMQSSDSSHIYSHHARHIPNVPSYGYCTDCKANTVPPACERVNVDWTHASSFQMIKEKTTQLPLSSVTSKGQL